MKKILSEKLPRILKNRKRLEEKLKVKITNRGKEVTINGKPEDEFIAEKVIDAINFGFPFSVAISIKEEDLEFEILNIKDHTSRKDLDRIRANYRNPTNHPEKIYNIEEAQDLFNLCVGVVNDIMGYLIVMLTFGE